MGIEYRVGDALEELGNEPAESAQFIHLDDAWARPKRNGAFGVTYPTHPIDEETADVVAGDPGVTTDLTGHDLLEACERVLQPGGVLAVDTDAYLLPKVLDWLREEWSSDCYRVAQVIALTQAGEPDCSTPGMYLSSGGYSVVLAWKDAAPIPRDHPLGGGHEPQDCACSRQREDWGWGTVKPLAPYRQWISHYTAPGDRVVVPCAGTAPAAIAAEREYSEAANALCIDIEPEAKAAYERRRADELDYQSTLV